MVRLSLAMKLSEIKQGEFRSRRRVDASASSHADEDSALMDPEDSDVEDLLDEADEAGDEDNEEEKENGVRSSDSKNGNGKRALAHPFTIDSAETQRKKTKKKYSKLISKRKSVLNTYLSQLYGLIDGSVDSNK
jgi:hypothetical protein